MSKIPLGATMRDVLLSVSVIIPVAEFTPELREALTHLEALDPGPEEILIFSDRHLSITTPRVRCVPTGHESPAQKRDRALSEARGDILAFLDDDAYPWPDWLRQALQHFDDPRVAAVGGPAMTPPQDGFWAQMSGAVLTSWLGSGPARMRYWPVGQIRTVDDWPSVNLLVRRSVFAEVGGFGTAVWPGEDTKLCLEIVRRGYRIIYAPAVVVYHHRATTPLRHLRQVARYGLHRGHFVRAFPETSRRLSYMLPSLSLVGVVSMGAATLLFPTLRFPFGVVLSALSTLIIGAGMMEAQRMRRWDIAVFFPAFLLATHSTYGLAFLRGLLSSTLAQYTRTQR